MHLDFDTLQTQRRKELLDTWRFMFGKPPPKGLSSPFLRYVLAFEHQARRYGGLPKGFEAKLERTAKDLTTGKASPPAASPHCNTSPHYLPSLSVRSPTIHLNVTPTFHSPHTSPAHKSNAP